ncbi:MAG: lysophospholipid acyltransferase (LPLAT)-like uncharacterized protein [Paracoccaceae bacterium]|jgi:lysophospholipid acyltransferase (LPLAT)-like uncharacterized protein
MAKRKRPLTSSQKIARGILQGFFEFCFVSLKTLRYDKPFTPQAPCVVASYHDELVPLVGLLANQNFLGIASLNHNGAAVAEVVRRRAAIDSVLGSTTKGGKEAFGELQESLAAGRSVCLSVDGSRGPRHEMKSGAVMLARRKKVPLYLVRCRTAGIRLPTWDRFLIPRPFAKVKTDIACIDFSDPSVKTSIRDVVSELNLQMQQLGAQ